VSTPVAMTAGPGGRRLAARRAGCEDCGWSEFFRSPGLARSQAASHRCDPAGRTRRSRAAAGSRRSVPVSPAEALSAAADAAAASDTAAAAVDIAWRVLAEAPAGIRVLATAWARAEGSDIPRRRLRRQLLDRYQTPLQIAGSLRAAALTLAGAL
jgi:hypothetical protein